MRLFNNIFVTGGAGYVGAVLVPRLLDKGYQVTVLDLMIYGEDTLPDHQNLTKVMGDLRDRSLLQNCLTGHDAIIHLACISNDPSFELNPALGKSVNLDSFRPLVEESRSARISRFIYVSSSSVYGIKPMQDVHEDMTLEPLTDYSRFKAECEEILLEYQSPEFTPVIVRPATVCGYSPRQRFDVVVNILTNVAYWKREMTVFGGDQLRPNIHIKDMVNAYMILLNTPKEKIAGKIFNAGDENQPVKKLAKIVKSVVGKDVKLVTTPSDDNRSYHISSRKIKVELGFETKHTIREAVSDLCNAFDNNLLPNSLDNEMYFNIKRMQSLNLY